MPVVVKRKRPKPHRVAMEELSKAKKPDHATQIAKMEKKVGDRKF